MSERTIYPLESIDLAKFDLGEIEMEPVEEADPMSPAERFIQSVYEAAETLSTREDTEAGRRYQATNFLEEQDYTFRLTDPSVDVATMDRTLVALNYLEERLGDVSLAGPMLRFVGADTLQVLYEQRSSGLFSMLQRAVKAQSWDNPSLAAADVLKAVEKTVSHKYGDRMSWRKKGEPIECEDFMLPIIQGKNFARRCVESAVVAAEAPSGLRERTYTERLNHMTALRDAEWQLTEEILGLPPDLSREFRRAAADRTMRKSKDDWTVPISEGGGVNIFSWQNVMSDFVGCVEALGRDRAVMLYKVFGITNFDRYAPAQLERQLLLLQGDERLLKRLRENDFTVGLVDSQGDHNNAFAAVNDALPTQDPKLYFEVHRPSDIYRSLIMLKRQFGLMPTHLAVYVHGGISNMQFNKDSEMFFVTATYNEGPRRLPIQQSSVGKFLREYMRPSRRTGERGVTLFSCNQATVGEQNPKLRQPTAEAIVEGTEAKDRVVVNAAADTVQAAVVRRRAAHQKKGFGFISTWLVSAHQFRVATPSQQRRTGEKVARKESPVISGLR